MLQEGDVIILETGMQVYATIPEHFIYTNRRGSFKLTHHHITLGGNFDYLCGKYIVYKTSYNGGNTIRTHGDFRPIATGNHDTYPDGHHVYCIKADDRDVKVDFYQSGCFTAMIEDIKPIGKAILQWEIDSLDVKCSA